MKDFFLLDNVDGCAVLERVLDHPMLRRRCFLFLVFARFLILLLLVGVLVVLACM